MSHFQCFELRADERLQRTRALDQAEPLHLTDRRHRRSKRHRVRLIRVTVREVMILKEVAYLFTRGAETQRHIGRRNAFGSDQNVGRDPPQVHGEPLACTAPARHDLVGDQQDPGLVADAAQLAHVLFRRHDHAVGADDRLDQHSRHVGLVPDHVFEIVGAGNVAPGIGVADGTLVAVNFWAEDDALRLAARLHGPAAMIASGGDRAGCRTVIRPVTSKDFGLAGVHPGDLERGFVRIGTGGGKEELVQALRQHFEQQLRQLRASRRGIAGHSVGKLLRLSGDAFNHSLVLVAQIHAHELRAEVQVALAVAVDDGAALGIDQMHRRPTLLEAPGAVVGLLGDLDDLSRGQRSGHGFMNGGRRKERIRSTHGGPFSERKVWNADRSRRIHKAYKRPRDEPGQVGSGAGERLKLVQGRASGTKGHPGTREPCGRARQKACAGSDRARRRCSDKAHAGKIKAIRCRAH